MKRIDPLKKLRLKVAGFATFSVAVLLIVILSTVNIINFTKVASEADQITQVIADNGGGFRDGNGAPSDGQSASQEATSEQTDQTQNEQPPSPDRPIPGGDETPYDTRFFTVTFANDGTLLVVDTSHIAGEEAKANAESMARAVLSKNVGWSSNFRYRVYHESNGNTMVIFIDQTRQLEPSFTVLWTSLGVFAGGILISFGLAYVLSKWMVAPIEAANRKQRRFLADASHELKTPITIISANNEIEEITVGESEATRTIAKQVARLADMVKEINALLALQNEEDIAVAEKDLTAIVEETLGDFSSVFASRSLKLDKDIQENVTSKIEEGNIRKLLSILLDNATKYGKSFVKVSLSSNKDRAEIKIENDADDVPEGDLERIFERFYRSDEARASGKEGSGIGLSMAKEIVSLHRGRIRAHGHDGVFTIKVSI